MAHSKSITEAGSEIAKDGAKAVKAGARKATDHAKAEASKQADAVKTNAANKIAGEAARLRAAAGEMTQDAPHTQAVETAAATLQDAATRVRQTDPNDLVRDLATFARRHPAASVAAATLAGFAIGRFFRSTNRVEPELPMSDVTTHHIPTPDMSVPS